MRILEKRGPSRNSLVVPYRCDVERDGVNKTQEKTKIGTPPVEYIKSFMADSGEHSHKICLHGHCNDPWYQSDRQHAGSDRNWRRTELNALPVERLWQKGVQADENQGCEHDDGSTERRKDDSEPSLSNLKFGHGVVEYEAEECNGNVQRPSDKWHCGI